LPILPGLQSPNPLRCTSYLAEEEKQPKNLETWVSNWTRAQQLRDFIAALEMAWKQEGHDLSPEAQKGQRICGEP
jgi:hypothetical protein